MWWWSGSQPLLLWSHVPGYASQPCTPETCWTWSVYLVCAFVVFEITMFNLKGFERNRGDGRHVGNEETAEIS